MMDRNIYLERYGDPKTWVCDCSARPGRYLKGAEQRAVSARLVHLEKMLIGMCVRLQPSGVIAACLAVSREAVDARRRDAGLMLTRGQGLRRLASRHDFPPTR